MSLVPGNPLTAPGAEQIRLRAAGAAEDHRPLRERSSLTDGLLRSVVGAEEAGG